MGLFSKAQRDSIDQAALKSKAALAPPKKSKSVGIQSELDEIYKEVQAYFHDSDAILITNKDQLHDYIDCVIDAGYAGIDTETTGLDRQNDYMVGTSLYYPDGKECYIPLKHRIPVFETLYKDQLTYEDVTEEFQRLRKHKVRLIFANADFDLSMIYKDLHVDFCDNCYYDVILAWRCLKENELHNGLKELYYKYVMRGQGEAKRFTDFFTPSVFPYVKPAIAALYAAADARMTYELFRWQLPYTIKTTKQCQKNHLENIADLIWGVEFPLIKVCQTLHRNGIYLDKDTSSTLLQRYTDRMNAQIKDLQADVQELLDKCTAVLPAKRPFTSGDTFNPTSPLHTKFLLCNVMGLLDEKSGTGKEILAEIHHPIAKKILKVRSTSVLINTFVKKLPAEVYPDGKIHAQFRQIGADTGRMSSAEPNLQNVPAHANDIRHMFRATAAKRQSVSAKSFTEDEVTFQLSRFDSVNMADGTKRRVEELSPGDHIVAKCDNEEHILIYEYSDPLEEDITTWVCRFAIEAAG